jgi:hypothetical protein
MIPLRADRCVFRGHETFPLRFGWLAKGYQGCLENWGALEDEDPRSDSESRTQCRGRALERSGSRCAG